MIEKIEDHIKTEYIDLNVNFKLQKDMHLNEEICQECNGLGIHIYDARYGLTVNGQKLGNGWFPFNKQSIVWCSSCYNGVRKRCEHCGELVDRKWVECQCDKSKEARGVAGWQKDLNQWNKAKKISYTEAANTYGMIYISDWDKYICLDDLYDEIEIWIDNNEDMWDNKEEIIDQLLNLRIYATSEIQVSFDAEDILTSATDDLHEDAYERSKYIIDDLQKALDGFQDKIKDDTTTYYSDESVGIQLTIEDIQDCGYLKTM